MTQTTPHISFVVAARNAEHDDTFLARLRTTLRLLNALVERHRVSCEYVIVQYNPPEGKPLLEHALADLPIHAMPVRVITVPAAFHDRIAPGRKGPFLEYVAKNIGVRRAHGEFVLVTNLDIVFSDVMVARLTGELDPGTVYRANRHDLSIFDIPESADADTALRICNLSTNRIWTDHGLLYVSWTRWFQRFLRKPSLRNILMAPLFNVAKRAMPARVIHDAAAGDFALAHRDGWRRVRGYDQGLFDAHLDSYNIALFVCHWFRQIVLPQPIYHINHFQNPSRQLPNEKEHERNMALMAKTKKPYTTYSEHWGSPEEAFPECLVEFSRG